MLKALLSNQFVVIVIDGLLHFASILALGVIIALACRLLSRGLVKLSLLRALLIALLLVITRIFLLNNLGHVIPEAGGEVQMVLIAVCLLFTTLLLVYKLAIPPLVSTFLISATIVMAQLSLAIYVPQLSLKLMPEGQRFAEFTGAANDRTKLLMLEAKQFEGQSKGFRKILADAAATIKFFTSSSEKETFSKDFASAVSLYNERKAYMDAMTPEELASYRKAMGAFLEEQGMQENRYSLSNLKNAKPDDLENLAKFLKEMSEEYNISDQSPQEGSLDSDELPTSMESLAQIAQSLSQAEMKVSELAKLGDLFGQLGVNPDLVMAEMAKTSEDFADIRDVTERMAKDFSSLATAGISSTDRPTDISSRKVALEKNYFKSIELSPFLTNSSQVLIPEKEGERALWEQASLAISIEACFTTQDNVEESTIFIEGSVLRNGDIWEQTHKGQIYRYYFKGVEERIITLIALERVTKTF